MRRPLEHPSAKLTSYRLESFGLTNVGHVRTNNEDSWKIVDEKNFFALADGMGGHNAGEVASLMAVESMCASMHSLPEDATVQQVCQHLRKAVATANGDIYEKARSDPLYKGMGTTLSCYLIKDQFLIYAHVGDSRLYRFRSGLHQLTADHSLQHHPRNMITRAIGTSPAIHPDIGIISLDSNDVYVLCSDGLSDYVAEATLSAIVQDPHSLEEMGGKLLNAALEKGGNDNITLLITKIHPSI